MRRSRKPVWAVPSIEGSNPSLSADFIQLRICSPKAASTNPIHDQLRVAGTAQGFGFVGQVDHISYGSPAKAHA